MSMVMARPSQGLGDPVEKLLVYLRALERRGSTVECIGWNTDLLRSFLDTLRGSIRLLDHEQLFELSQLPLEAHVWENHRPTLARKGESLLKPHAPLLHEKGNNARCAPRDTGIAVDEHATSRDSFLDKGDGSRKVPQ